jgi:NADH dehydrogenase [ubiquinone] 1 alpha subcomplex assembly factor 7
MAKLLETASGERKEDIRKGATRLIDVLGMGSQYQVMGIEPGGSGMGEVYPFPAEGSEGIEAVLAKPSSS